MKSIGYHEHRRDAQCQLNMASKFCNYKCINYFVGPQEKMATLIMQIKVKLRARVSSLEQAPDGTWLANLKSPPVDGKANKELVALVAEHLSCHKAAVTIKSGASGRTKLVRIETA